VHKKEKRNNAFRRMQMTDITTGNNLMRVSVAQSRSVYMHDRQDAVDCWS